MNLLETGLETDIVLALIVFSLQYVFVNHEFWKYKMKHARWKVTLKVLEVMKKCIASISCSQKLGEIVCDIMLSDSSIHSTLFRIVCTTTPSLEKLYMSRLFDTLDIEGLQLAISAGLDVLVSMTSAFSKDAPSLPVFHQAILSPMAKPIPVICAAISLISYTRDAKIQMGAARLLSALFIADLSQSYTHSNASLGLDDKQVASFRKSTCNILSDQSPYNEDLIVATLKLLTSAALNQPALITASFVSNEYLSAQLRNSDSEHQPNKNENGSLDSKEESLLYAILRYLKNSEDLFHSNPNILLSLLNFLRALWQGAPQFQKTLEQLKVLDKFWKQLTNSVMLITNNQSNLSERSATGKKLQNIAYRYKFLSNVLDILGYEIFLQKKLMHACKSPSNRTEKAKDSKLTQNQSLSSLKETISTLCKSSWLSDLVKSCVSWEFDNSRHLHAKISAGLFAVHAMVKFRQGDLGSLSVSLAERIVTLSQKLFKLPAFPELLSQYAERGYSGGQDLENLILSDLFYHIQGELEGRQIDNRLFKELLQFLLDSKFLDVYKHKQDDDLSANNMNIYLYDTDRLKTDLGLEMWDLNTWKESEEVAETMLHFLEDVNSRVSHSNSKLSALRGLITLLYMHENNLSEDEGLIGLRISEQIVSSCIDHICHSLFTTLNSLTPLPEDTENLLDILTSQAELLLLLVSSKNNYLSQPASALISKTVGYALKVLSACRPSPSIATSSKFFLMLILTSIECKDSNSAESSLALLPILCNFTDHPDHSTLSLAAIDLILKSFPTYTTWFPIIQKHLPLQHIVQKLQNSETVTVTLKFLLNLARVRQGSEMLVNAGILASLRTLLSDFSERIFSSISDKNEKSEPIWGLSFAVLTAIIQSLRDTSASASIVDYVMACIIVEKANLISYYLNAPDFPTDGHESKKARAFKSNISLSELKETENTLTLICVLATHSNSWKKVLQNMESQLREKSIHFLSFISGASQRPGETLGINAPLLCHPVLKEEFEWYKKPAFVNSRNGWFALGCKLNPRFASLSSRTNALVLREQSYGNNGDLSPQTYLSDLIGIEMYKIAFLLLKFLCIQAENAVRKAEEVGFVDVANFPELPMPNILHGLQDQGFAIITELCEANKTRQVDPEIQKVWLLLLHVIIMALYLEFCVIQICGIRSVLGRVETFSKELRLLIRATEGVVFLKEPLNTLKQILSFVYPDLVQQEALF